MRRRKLASREWIDANEAAEILSKNSGYTITPAYVRLMAHKSMIRSRNWDGRTKEYFLEDVQTRVITQKRSKKEKNEEENAEKLEIA